MPGDNTNMDIELIQPIAMDQGLRFAIREGGPHRRRRRRHRSHQVGSGKANSMAQGKIRIRLKGYDHQQLDRSAQQIVDTAQRSGATDHWAGSLLPTEKNVYCVIRSPFKDKDSLRAFRGAHATSASSTS